MARPLRIEFPGAIYHAISRGNARQRIFRDEQDYERFLSYLESTVLTFAWDLMALVLMPNHVHLFFQTLQANLSLGMQRLLSSYSNWFAKQHRCPGHLLQGRFKGEMVEDESYFWEVSRYIHLNPVRGKRPLVSRPEQWPWSSYLGYFQPENRIPWVAYDRIYESWKGAYGGDDPVASYRRYVEDGLVNSPANPFERTQFGWLLGSDAFVEQIRRRMKHPVQECEVPLARPLTALDVDTVFAAVASFYGVSDSLFQNRRHPHIARPVAAWLARRHTVAKLRELAPRLGLGRAESVGNLRRRIDQELESNQVLTQEISQLELILRELRAK